MDRQITLTALNTGGEVLEKDILDLDDHADVGFNIDHIFQREPDCVKIELVRGDDGTTQELNEAIAAGDPDANDDPEMRR